MHATSGFRQIYDLRNFIDDKEFAMARRRKSSKTSDAAGVILLILLGLAAAVFNFVATHYIEIGVVGVVIGAVWLVARAVRSKRLRVGGAPARSATSPVAQALRSTSDTMLHSTNSEIKSGFFAGNLSNSNKAPDPSVRITPIVDPPMKEGMPARSWPQGRGSEPKVGNARWVQPGESVNVQGIEIASGWFYLSSEMRSGYSPAERCLINPKLPIAKRDDSSPEGESYASSYSAFTPSQRRTFLEWMAGGRRNPDIGDDAVRFFVDCLEYRVFRQGVRSEIPELVEEVERMLNLYGTRASFSGSAIRFIAYASALLPDPKRPDLRFAKVAGFVGPEELSPQVRVFIGNKLVKGEPITVDDALVWAVALPNVWLRTPATRCWEELVALWSIRFNDRYPSGFPVQTPRTRISLSYPAEQSFSRAPLHGDFEKLPDIASVRSGATKLTELVEACTNELDAYSRFLGRHEELTGTPRAGLFLPEDLWRKRYERSIETMAAMLGDEELGVGTLEELMAGVDFSLDGASSKELAAVLDRFSSALRHFDIGVEPKGSHVENVLSAEFPVSLFRLHVQADTGTEDDRGGWRTVVDIALVGVAAAGSITDAARVAAYESIAADFPGLDLTRIWAYTVAVEPSATRLAKMLKAAGDWPVADRQYIARCAVSTALSGGSVPSSTVKFLERLYGALHFTSSDLYAVLHRGDAERPASASPGTPTEAGLDAVNRTMEGDRAAVPSSSGAVVIDPERLARARESTNAVSKILAGVFMDDHPAAKVKTVDEAPQQAEETNGSAFSGLDASHATLLSIVIDKGSLERKDFEARAKELKLLADGAIEHINDWAYDHFEGPLIEDGDTVTLVSHLHDRAAEMRGTGQ